MAFAVRLRVSCSLMAMFHAGAALVRAHHQRSQRRAGAVDRECIVVQPDSRGSPGRLARPDRGDAAAARSPTGPRAPRSCGDLALSRRRRTARARRRQRRPARRWCSATTLGAARRRAARSGGDRLDHCLLRRHAGPARRRHHPRRRHRAQRRQLHLHHRPDQRDGARRHDAGRSGEHADARARPRAGAGAHLLGSRDATRRRSTTPASPIPDCNGPSADEHPRHDHVPLRAMAGRDLQARPRPPTTSPASATSIRRSARRARLLSREIDGGCSVAPAAAIALALGAVAVGAGAGARSRRDGGAR